MNKYVLYDIPTFCYIVKVWKIKQTDQFGQWFGELDSGVREDIYSALRVLAEYGPKLGRPYVDTVNDSNYTNMKELRVQCGGQPYRIFFAFDPQRNAVLLVGGNKKGNKRFYKKYIPVADALFKTYLEDMKDG